MLKGNPIVENVLYVKGAAALPTTGATWRSLGPWPEIGQFDNEEFTVAGGINVPITWSNQYILIAVPRANINGNASGAKGSHKIKLDEIYDKDAPAFTYGFTYIDVPNDEDSPIVGDSGYRIYYVPDGKYTGGSPEHPATLVLEFKDLG